MMKKFATLLLSLCLVVGCFMAATGTTSQAATKDKTKPTITLTPDNIALTNEAVRVNVTVTDASGIKTLKWEAGKHGATFFKTGGQSLKFSTKGKAAFSATANGMYSVYAVDKAGNAKINTITITNIDQILPTLGLTYSVMDQVATVTVKARDASGIGSIVYLKGETTNVEDPLWTNKGTLLDNSVRFNVTDSGIYSVMVTDKAGNKAAQIIKVNMELHAVWISYLEFGTKGYTETAFRKYIDELYDNSLALNMNAVIVQVRPFGDAMYPSNYFPWSKYVSGTQGKNPGFDPLAYMIEAAHARGLEFHAWLNPYRITLGSTDLKALSSDNPARVWSEDADTSNDRNVLTFGPSLYYNPASPEVQEMIVADIADIVTNYDVDGIHFDDYFYPSLGTKYASTFDNVEYKTYYSETATNGQTPMKIDAWRRENVNTLVRTIHSTIQSIKPSVRFGISPHGNIDNLLSNQKYYVDIEKWLASSDYVDYIAPQIYWSFSHKVCPFDATLDRWNSIRTSKTVSMYVGIANYKAKATISDDPEWKKSNDELMRQIEFGRSTGKVDGYFFFRYENFFNTKMKTEIDNLMAILPER